MVTAMQAVHCVSWEPLSGQDMRLAWQRRSMHNHQEVSTTLFRKSLCVRMRISSSMNNHGTRKSDAFRRAVVSWSDYIRDMGYEWRRKAGHEGNEKKPSLKSSGLHVPPCALGRV